MERRAAGCAHDLSLPPVLLDAYQRVLRHGVRDHRRELSAKLTPPHSSGQFDHRHVHFEDRPVEVDVVELAAQHDGVGGGDEYLGERHWRDQQGSAESVDALDDEFPRASTTSDLLAATRFRASGLRSR